MIQRTAWQALKESRRVHSWRILAGNAWGRLSQKNQCFHLRNFLVSYLLGSKPREVPCANFFCSGCVEPRTVPITKSPVSDKVLEQLGEPCELPVVAAASSPRQAQLNGAQQKAQAKFLKRFQKKWCGPNGEVEWFSFFLATLNSCSCWIKMVRSAWSRVPLVSDDVAPHRQLAIASCLAR